MNWLLILAVALAIVVPPVWGWLLYHLYTSLGFDRRLPAPVHGEPLEAPGNDDAWDYQI